MKDYKELTADEATDLRVKIGKLIGFMHSDVYSTLPTMHQGLLMVQLEAMSLYHNTLLRRLEVFKQ